MFSGFERGEKTVVLVLISLIGGAALFGTWSDHLHYVTTAPSMETADAVSSLEEKSSVNKRVTERDPTESSSLAVKSGRLDPNKATASQLEALPGIGPSKAEAIIYYRTHYSEFIHLSDLENVHGIGPKTVQRLEPFLTLEEKPKIIPAPGQEQVGKGSESTLQVAHREGSSSLELPPARVAVNKAGLLELQNLKGVGPVIAQRILEYRTLNGPIRNSRDLMNVKGIGPKTVEINREILSFE